MEQTQLGEDTNSAGSSSELVTEKDRNEKTFNFINNKIMKGLKEDLQGMVVAINDESNKNSEDSSESESSTTEGFNNRRDKPKEFSTEESKNESTTENNNTGVSNFKSYDKNQHSMEELSKGTQDLLKELDVMNPVMEKSMKMLEDIDIEKMEKLMEKFGKFGNMFDKK